MKKTVDSLRAEIGEIDTELLKILEIRLQVAREIGYIKIQNNIPKTDENRENEVVSRLQNQASDELVKVLIKEIYPVLFKFSKIAQNLTSTYSS